MLVAALILAVVSVLSFAILPVKVRHAEGDATTLRMTGDRPEQDVKSDAVTP